MAAAHLDEVTTLSHTDTVDPVLVATTPTTLLHTLRRHRMTVEVAMAHPHHAVEGEAVTAHHPDVAIPMETATMAMALLGPPPTTTTLLRAAMMATAMVMARLHRLPATTARHRVTLHLSHPHHATSDPPILRPREAEALLHLRAMALHQAPATADIQHRTAVAGHHAAGHLTAARSPSASTATHTATALYNAPSQRTPASATHAASMVTKKQTAHKLASEHLAVTASNQADGAAAARPYAASATTTMEDVHATTIDPAAMQTAQTHKKMHTEQQTIRMHLRLLRAAMATAMTTSKLSTGEEKSSRGGSVSHNRRSMLRLLKCTFVKPADADGWMHCN